MKPITFEEAQRKGVLEFYLIGETDPAKYKWQYDPNSQTFKPIIENENTNG